MYCIHESSYKSKKTKENQLASTVRIGCKAFIYARKEQNSSKEDKIIIKSVHNIHNHSALSEEEYKTAPQVIKLSANIKDEALNLYREGEKFANIIQTIVQKYYGDSSDTYTLGAFKQKLANLLNNQSKTVEALDLKKILSHLGEYIEDIIWLSLKQDTNIEVIFFTFKHLIQKGKSFLI